METEEKIEFILTRLEKPERILEKEFIQWLEIEENKKLFDEVMLHREAFLRNKYGKFINKNQEWQTFETLILRDHQETNTRKTKTVKPGTWYTVAAGICILMAVAGSLLLKEGKQKTEKFPETILTGKRSAELILNDGKVIDLSKQIIHGKAVDGTLISNDRMKMLSYQKDLTTTKNTTTQNIPQTSPAKNNDIPEHTLRIPAGADYLVILADGTKVWLNCESTLRFPVEFAKDQREVYLDGEGYFEVNKASEWPFIVHTAKMRVQVTGTRFNVKSYPADSLAYTTLVQGSVWVHSDELQTQLKPSEQFQLNKMTGKASVQQVDPELYTGWIEGMFVFRNQRLEEVMNDLTRWYKMNVFYTTSEIKDIRISANLGRYENIDDLLEIINESGKVITSRNADTITIQAR